MRSHLALLVLLVAGVCVIATTVSDYGIGWDEAAQSTYGELTHEYFSSGGSDRRVNEFLDLHLYGPVFEWFAAELYIDAQDAKYTIRHVLTALAGLATLAAVALLAGRFELAWATLFAPLFLALLPRFYGHAFVNSKDVPFAAAIAWTFVALLRFLEKRGAWSAALLLGVAAGLALALRPGGAPLLVAMMAVPVGHAVLRGNATGSTVVRLLPAFVVAWIVMVAAWPWAHEAPIANPLRAMQAAMAFPTAYEVLFAGEAMRSDALPRSYFAHFLLITSPIPTLLFACLGGALCVRDVAGAAARSSRRALLGCALLAWFAIPLASAAVLRPNVYDGLRHVLFLLPALALLAARGAAECVRLASDRFRSVVVAAMIAIALLPAWQLVKLHPYQMTYFNALVGGVSGASGRYETDYWVTSYREAAEWLNERAATRGPLRVIGAIDSHSHACLSAFLDDSIELAPVSDFGALSEIPAGYDYYVGTTRYGLDERFSDSPIVLEVGRDGARFTVIRGRDPASR